MSHDVFVSQNNGNLWYIFFNGRRIISMLIAVRCRARAYTTNVMSFTAPGPVF